MKAALALTSLVFLLGSSHLHGQELCDDNPMECGFSMFSVAPDSATTFVRITVESAHAGFEIPFSGQFIDPGSGLPVHMLEGMTTPYAEKFVAGELIGLFRNLDPRTGMIINIEDVENGDVARWALGEWDFTMVMKRGEQLLTAGL
jgi:hypothetical protein